MTGVVYDMRMTEHRNLWDPKHPEVPERFSCILERCKSLDLLSRCTSIPSRAASIEEIKSLHSKALIETLKDICENMDDLEKAEEIASTYEAVYFHPSTYDLALLSCGSTIDLVTNVLDGNIKNGMAIIRPPGHHAMKDQYCGFCYFNNVAVAAKLALEEKGLKRILIVDFDVHHGQATQQFFYNDPRVLYFSTHRYEHGTAWPHLEESNYNWIGNGEGDGFNVNFPLNKIGMANAEFLTIWHKILLPLAYQFNPELVIVSAGYDAALGCPEGEMRMTPQCYPHLIHPLMGLANGKIAVILEGGYCLKSLAEGAALTLRTLLGDPCPLISPIATPAQVVVHTILEVTSMLRDHWHLGLNKFVDDPEFQKCLASDEGFKPTYRFEGEKSKPSVFATREFYGAAVQSEEVRMALDKELDQLILATSLAKAKHRVGVATSVPFDTIYPECQNQLQSTKFCYKIPVRIATEKEMLIGFSLSEIEELKNAETWDTHLRVNGTFFSVIDEIAKGNCQSGVVSVGTTVDVPGKSENFKVSDNFKNIRLAVDYARRHYSFERILLLDLDGQGVFNPLGEEPGILHISINSVGEADPVETTSKNTKFRININLPRGKEDLSLISAFTNIILPIAYEFGPQIILVSNITEAHKDGLDRIVHVTYMLKALAGGNLMVCLDGCGNDTIRTFVDALLGVLPRPALTEECWNHTSVVKAFEKYSHHWSVLTPFRKVLPVNNRIQRGFY